MEPLLRVRNLSKRYGILDVLTDLSFDVYPEEVLGIVGRSGAGKTVLAHILSGLNEPDSGQLWFEGKNLKWPFHALSFGIDVIQQKPALVERLDVTSNIFLGRELQIPFTVGWLNLDDLDRMDRIARTILDQLGIGDLSIREKVDNLSNEHRQLIAIAQTLTHSSRLLIIDDPTSILSFSFQQKLVELIHEWRKKGTAVIFLSKDLDHLFAVTDRMLVLQNGRGVAEFVTDDTSREDIVATLLGTTNRRELTPAIWAMENYYKARNQSQSLQDRQHLLEQSLEIKDSHIRQLFEQLSQQVQALDQANLALQEAQRRVLTEREEERKHLARELHDQIIQDLLSVNYHLKEVEERQDVSAGTAQELFAIREDIRSFVDDLRRICSNLRPPTIDSLGLGSALQSYMHNWQKRYGIGVVLRLDENLGRLPEHTELSVFRIVQEGLSNVWQHSAAEHVEIELQHTSPRTLMLTIRDDGAGLPDDFNLSQASSEGHFGLLGISERATLLGGRLSMKNQNQGGLIIQVEIPHPRVAASSQPELNSL